MWLARTIYLQSLIDSILHRHHFPIVHQTWPHPTLDRDEHAVVTALTDNAFAPAVATLGHSIRKANITARLILFYLPQQVSKTSLCIATASGWHAQEVSRITPPDGAGDHFVDTYIKLHLWELDKMGIKSLVYLDADTIVQKNFDELFSLPFSFAAVPDIYLDDRSFTLGFNAGILYLRPSTAVYDDMVAKIYTADFPRWEADQAFMNIYFGNEVVRLPYAYNGNLAIKWHASKLWKETTFDRRIIHYTLTKPFVGDGYSEVPLDEMENRVTEVAENAWEGAFRKEMYIWRDMFTEMKHEYEAQLGSCLNQGRAWSRQRY